MPREHYGTSNVNYSHPINVNADDRVDRRLHHCLSHRSWKNAERSLRHDSEPVEPAPAVHWGPRLEDPDCQQRRAAVLNGFAVVQDAKPQAQDLGRQEQGSQQEHAAAWLLCGSRHVD
jgi:hypothetical protein